MMDPHLHLNALKAAAYDTLVQIEHLQARLRALHEQIALESRRLTSNGPAPAPVEEEAVR